MIDVIGEAMDEDMELDFSNNTLKMDDLDMGNDEEFHDPSSLPQSHN